MPKCMHTYIHTNIHTEDLDLRIWLYGRQVNLTCTNVSSGWPSASGCMILVPGRCLYQASSPLLRRRDWGDKDEDDPDEEIVAAVSLIGSSRTYKVRDIHTYTKSFVRVERRVYLAVHYVEIMPRRKSNNTQCTMECTLCTLFSCEELGYEIVCVKYRYDR